MKNVFNRKSSDFRLWVNKMWYEHLAELESYKQPINYTSYDYFRRYKFWLKREYQYQKKVHNEPRNFSNDIVAIETFLL